MPVTLLSLRLAKGLVQLSVVNTALHEYAYYHDRYHARIIDLSVACLDLAWVMPRPSLGLTQIALRPPASQERRPVEAVLALASIGAPM